MEHKPYDKFARIFRTYAPIAQLQNPQQFLLLTPLLVVTILAIGSFPRRSEIERRQVRSHCIFAVNASEQRVGLPIFVQKKYRTSCIFKSQLIQDRYHLRGTEFTCSIHEFSSILSTDSTSWSEQSASNGVIFDFGSHFNDPDQLAENTRQFILMQVQTCIIINAGLY